MKVNIKKTISLLICVVSLFTLCSGVFAAETKENIISKKGELIGGEILNQSTVSEYDMFQKLQNKTYEELKAIGYTNENIKYIKNFDMVAEIKKIANNSNSDLKARGYSSEQINILENFDGSEEQIRALSAQLITTIAENGNSSSSSYSYVDFLYHFEWTSMPIFGFDDMLAIAWSDDMNCNGSASTSECQIFYYDTILGY